MAAWVEGHRVAPWSRVFALILYSYGSSGAIRFPNFQRRLLSESAAVAQESSDQGYPTDFAELPAYHPVPDSSASEAPKAPRLHQMTNVAHSNPANVMPNVHASGRDEL